MWVPEESFKLLRGLAANPKFSIPESAIDFIILELNKIWKRREEFIVNRCHVFCKNCKGRIIRSKGRLESNEGL